MTQVLRNIQEKAKDYPEIAQVQSLYEGEVPQYRIDMDRNKIQMMGINLADVYSTLSAFVGGSYVNDLLSSQHLPGKHCRGRMGTQ